MEGKSAKQAISLGPSHHQSTHSRGSISGGEDLGNHGRGTDESQPEAYIHSRTWMLAQRRVSNPEPEKRGARSFRGSAALDQG